MCRFLTDVTRQHRTHLSPACPTVGFEETSRGIGVGARKLEGKILRVGDGGILVVKGDEILEVGGEAMPKKEADVPKRGVGVVMV